MVAFQEEHPQFHVGLLTYSLEYLLGNKWPGNKLMYDHNVCSEECSIGQQDDCGCTCTMDPFELSDDEVCHGHESRALVQRTEFLLRMYREERSVSPHAAIIDANDTHLWGVSARAAVRKVPRT